MKAWVIAGILLASLTVQSTIFPFLEIAGVKPDTLMMLVVSFALLAGNPTGLAVGFFGGLIQDILYGGALGYNAIMYMLVGYLLGFVYERLYIGKVILPVFFVFCSIIFRGLLMMVYHFFMRSDIRFYQGFAVVIIPEAIYSAILMPLLHFFMAGLYQRPFMSKKWSLKR